MVLLTVLLVALVVTGVAVSFISFMNQQQSRTGQRYRSKAALTLAEAGIHRAVAIFEGLAPDGSPGRDWRLTDYSEDVSVGPVKGRFTLTVTDEADGAVLVTSVGEIGGVRRGLRARVSLASPAMLAALYGRSDIRLDGPPAATVIVPYGAGAGTRPWTHIAAGQGIWFAGTRVSINRGDAAIPHGAGPIDSLMAGVDGPRLAPARLVLATTGDLLVDRDQVTTGIQPLRAMGMNLHSEESRIAAFPEPPEVDRASYQSAARNNTANASFNNAAGDALTDPDLAQKRDSYYTRQQFERLQRFSEAARRPLAFQGIVYVTGGVTVSAQGSLQITDGALITEGSVRLGNQSRLEIVHSGPTRTLPGLIAFENGGLFVGADAQLRVHGVVYTDWLFEAAAGARIVVVGSIVAADLTLSLWNMGASVVIRYDPAVLGTLGLSAPPHSAVIAWIASWEELP